MAQTEEEKIAAAYHAGVAEGRAEAMAEYMSREQLERLERDLKTFIARRTGGNVVAFPDRR